MITHLKDLNATEKHIAKEALQRNAFQHAHSENLLFAILLIAIYTVLSHAG